MVANTKISWADHTFNSHWGCTEDNPIECRLCYARALARRTGHDVWGPDVERRTQFSDAHWNEPHRLNAKAAEQGRVESIFCGSMMDWAEQPRAPESAAQLDQSRARLFGYQEHTPWLFWMLLSKRAKTMGAVLPDDWGAGPANVMLMTTVGTVRTLPKLGYLKKTPAAWRGVSIEPMIDPDLDPRPWFEAGGIHLAILGGESGPLRPTENQRAAVRLDPEAALRVLVAAEGAGLVSVMKQTGSQLAKEWKLEDRAGADPADWPLEFQHFAGFRPVARLLGRGAEASLLDPQVADSPKSNIHMAVGKAA